MFLEKLLSQPEGKTLEFKRDLSSLKPILKTLVAFANTAGGTLLIGRTNDGTDSLEVPLRLGDLETTIQFVETHRYDVKTILEEMRKSGG